MKVPFPLSLRQIELQCRIFHTSVRNGDVRKISYHSFALRVRDNFNYYLCRRKAAEWRLLWQTKIL